MGNSQRTKVDCQSCKESGKVDKPPLNRFSTSKLTMNDKDYILNDDGSVECRECGCVTDMDTYKDEGAQHWNSCSKLSEEADYHE